MLYEAPGDMDVAQAQGLAENEGSELIREELEYHRWGPPLLDVHDGPFSKGFHRPHLCLPHRPAKWVGDGL